MTTRFVRYATAAAAVLMSGVACSDDVAPDTIPNGGTGGASSGAGGTGGSGGQPGGTGGSGGSSGSSGSGGSGGSDMPDGGLAQFTAALEGNEVRLTTSDPVWVQTCAPSPRLVQQVGGVWTPLQDDRPPASNLLIGAHYLDGSLQPACRLSLGCDVGGCDAFPLAPEPYVTFYNRLVAREFVQVGQASAPTCDALDAGIPADAGSDAGVRLVPDIESRAPAGPIGVEIHYWRDSQCSEGNDVTTVVPVE
jgi:hypothetical protein